MRAELARRGPAAHTLLSYCIVSAARCAVLEQVSSPLPRSLRCTAPLYGLSSCFVIGISLPLYLPSLFLSLSLSPRFEPQLVLFSLRSRRTTELACKSSTRGDYRESPSSKSCGILSTRYRATLYLLSVFLRGNVCTCIYVKR